MANLKYRRSKRGKIKCTYGSMKKRVKGKCKSANLYKGLDICSLGEFYQWSNEDSIYNQLHEKWVASNYDDNIKPSIDRIDTTKGYIIGNMRWTELLTNISNHK